MMGLDLIDDDERQEMEQLAEQVDTEDEFDWEDFDDTEQIMEFVDGTDADHAAYVKRALNDGEECDPFDLIEEQLRQLERQIAEIRLTVRDARANG